MRLILLLCTIIALLIGAILFLFTRNQKVIAEKNLQIENFKQVVKKSDEQTKILNITIATYKESFKEFEQTIKEKDIKLNRLLSHTKIVYQTKIDTLLYPIKDTLYLPSDDLINYYEFNTACINAKIQTNDTSKMLELKIYGQIPIDIIEYKEKKKNWFWRGLWGSGKWQTEIKVFNNCNLEIKENIKFVIK